MLLDLKTKNIYTNKGNLIKQMYCPKKPDWEKFRVTENEPYQRICNQCQFPVVDTKHYNDQELLEMVNKNPNVCFKVSVGQKNLILIEEK